MTKARKPRYRATYWPVVGVPVQQVMPWAVVSDPPRRALPILSRTYTRHAAQLICRALNAQPRKGKQ